MIIHANNKELIKALHYWPTSNESLQKDQQWRNCIHHHEQNILIQYSKGFGDTQCILFIWSISDLGPLLLTKMNYTRVQIKTLICNWNYVYQSYVFTHPHSNISGGLVKLPIDVRVWISKCFPQKVQGMITYPCHSFYNSMLVKWTPWIYTDNMCTVNTMSCFTHWGRVAYIMYQ